MVQQRLVWSRSRNAGDGRIVLHVNKRTQLISRLPTDPVSGQSRVHLRHAERRRNNRDESDINTDHG